MHVLLIIAATILAAFLALGIMSGALRVGARRVRTTPRALVVLLALVYVGFIAVAGALGWFGDTPAPTWRECPGPPTASC